MLYVSDNSYLFWKVSPHTFLLGAGASRAAFPNGDKYGRKLALMNDFVKVVGLEYFYNDKENFKMKNKHVFIN